MHQIASAAAVLSAFSQSSNEVTQGWMRLLSGAPAETAAPAWLGELQRAAVQAGALQAKYFEKQGKLGAALLSGRKETVAKPQPGDRRFSSSQWRDDAYFDYLRQSYL